MCVWARSTSTQRSADMLAGSPCYRLSIMSHMIAGSPCSLPRDACRLPLSSQAPSAEHYVADDRWTFV